QIPGIARRVVDEIRRLTPAPVRYIVNTHWHGDHLLGNSVFREAFPEARIVAHSHTAAEGARYYADYAAKSAERLPRAMDDMRRRRDASRSGEEREFLERTVACAERLLPEIPRTRYVAPDLLVDGSLRVELGGVAVSVEHLGSGNTPGDLVAWVEGDRLVATGDLLVHPAPYAIGSALEPWIATLGRLRARNAAVIVPGHGPVMRDDRYLRDVEALIAGTHRQLTAMLASGVARSEAAARLDVAAFRDRYLDTPMRRQAFEQFFVKAAVQKAYAAAAAPATPAAR
ncbi:MAG TPA: MBL fold metallo-hydrolase, partial [Myxococcota bacterium]|nr:MBL fold metallo-hydrolase [Myxococcota bacterium]